MPRTAPAEANRSAILRSVDAGLGPGHARASYHQSAQAVTAVKANTIANVAAQPSLPTAGISMIGSGAITSDERKAKINAFRIITGTPQPPTIGRGGLLRRAA